MIKVTALPNIWFIGWSIMPSYPLLGIGTYLIVCSLTREEQWLIKDLLQNKVLDYLGKISYGLYVYHLLARDYAMQMAILFNVSIERLVVYPFFVFLAGLVVTILMSIASYQLLEKPFLRLKERFTIIQSSPV